MQEITVQDCVQLREKFLKYCNTAEQHQFPMLAMINVKLDSTLEKLQQENKVTNQSEARAMFRVVLKVIGEDFSEYEERFYKNECINCGCYDSDTGCSMPSMDRSYACPIEKERFDE